MIIMYISIILNKSRPELKHTSTQKDHVTGQPVQSFSVRDIPYCSNIVFVDAKKKLFCFLEKHFFIIFIFESLKKRVFSV